MKTAFVFPGQGSQKLKMGQELFNSYPEAKAVFEEASEAIALNIPNLIFGEDEAILKKTENTQVCLMVVSIAVLRVLEKEMGKKLPEMADVLAGHSLGEYSALCAAGAISLKDTSIILRKRGEFMASAMPSGGGMLAVIGLSEEKLEEVILKAKEAEILVIANDNSNGQIVLSGNEAAIERAGKIAKEMGAKMAVKLEVSGPFHSPLLLKASEKMKDALNEIEIKMPEIPVINNVNVEVYSSVSEIREILAKQVVSKVRWRETMLKMEESGVKTAIEIGSGKVLSGLFKRTCKEIQTFSVETEGEISNLSAYIK